MISRVLCNKFRTSCKVDFTSLFLLKDESKELEFKNIAVPAPFVLRPFAGIYNPFPYGCSILCNHPADCEAKDVVKRAKESWVSSMYIPNNLL